MIRRALVTGCTGQTGSYMCEILLEKGYEVFGLVRRSSTRNFWRIHHLLNRVNLLEGDLTDEPSLRHAVLQANPDEIYHFASQSHVGSSFLEPVHTTEVTAIGALRMFEAVRTSTSHSEYVRIYQASSSEQFGNTAISPQQEDTPMHPVSPYGCAKLFAHAIAHVYRQSYRMFISCGIAYNHESPRRGEEFVTRKITKSVAQIKLGKLAMLSLGNISAKRDWSHAKDIAAGAWLTLQQELPEDWLFASGEQHSVKEFYELAFHHVGLEAHPYVNPMNVELLRPQDIASLVGYAGKAHRRLGWRPAVSFQNLVYEMVDADLANSGLRYSSAPQRLEVSQETPPVVPAPDLSKE